VHSISELEETLAHYQKTIKQEAGNLQRRFEGYPKDTEEPDPLTHFLLEECMAGEEITVDSCIVDGVATHIPPCKYLLSEEFGFDDHHIPIRVIPYDLSEKDLKHIYEVVDLSYKALGADYCITHAELFYNPEDHSCRVIEVASRAGGFRAEMVRHSCGDDLDLAAVNVALGLEPGITSNATKYTAVTEVFSPSNGILEAIDVSCLEGRDDVHHITHNNVIGDKVGRAKDGRSFVMKFLTEAESYDEVVAKASKFLLSIRNSIKVKEEA